LLALSVLLLKHPLSLNIRGMVLIIASNILIGNLWLTIRDWSTMWIVDDVTFIVSVVFFFALII